MVEHPITMQHDRLEHLLDEVRSALKSRDESVAQTVLGQLCEAVDAHFGLEERVHFPRISALRPERRPELRVLANAHGNLRRLLSAVVEQQESDVPGAIRALEGFADSLALHEAAEEELLCNLEVELGYAP